MKNFKKIIIALLCFAMLLPLSTSFVVSGAEQTPIPDEDFENLTLEDMTEPNWTGFNNNNETGGADIATAPEGKKLLEKVDIPTTKALNSNSSSVQYGITTISDNLPSTTGEVSFDLYIDECSWKGLYISFGYNNGSVLTAHSSVVFFKPSLDTSNQYTSYGDAIVAAYAGGGSSIVAPSFHKAYVPIAGTAMENGEYMEMDRWYNVKIVLTSGASTAALYIDDYKIGDIKATASVSLINSIYIQKMANGGGVNNVFVDNITLRETSTSTPYYFEDFEGYTLGEAPTSVWDKGNYSPLSISSVNVPNKVLGFVKNENTPSATLTLSEGLPTYTNEVSFDIYVDYTTAQTGMRFELYSGSAVKAMLNFFKPRSSDAVYTNKIMIGYYDASNSSVIVPSYHRIFIPALDTEELLELDTWYNIKLKWAKGASSGSLYVDGVLVNDAIQFENTDNVIDKILLQPGNQWGTDAMYLDNIKLYGDNSDTPYYSADFTNDTVGTAASGWVVGSVPVNVGSLSSYPSHTYTTVSSSNALRVWQNGAKIASVKRHFEATDKMSISFDYMPTSVSTVSGSYLTLFSGESTKYYLRVYKPSASDTNATLAYYGGSFIKVTELPLGVWYNIKIVFENGVAKLYLDGEYLCNLADNTSSISTVDRMCFGTISGRSAVDEFYIDNLKFTDAYNIEVKDMTTEFTDNFNSENIAYTYSGTGSHTVADGKLNLEGDVSVIRALPDNAKTGKFGFTLESSAPSGVTFDIMSGATTAVSVKIGDNGALYYKRDNIWNICTNTGVIEAGKTAEIALDMPDGRNANYFNITVNGEIVGTALYHTSFVFVDGIRITVPSGASATVDDVFAEKSAGIIAPPDRGDEKDPIIYLPEVIEDVRVMYLVNDSNPESSSLKYADENTGVFAFDYNRNSIGVDLGSPQQINAIRVIGNADTERGFTLTYVEVWYSDDNQTWDKTYGHILNFYKENGVSAMLVEFNGVNARYVKLHYTSTQTPSSITVDDLTADVRAERKIARQWELAGTAMYVLKDTDPAATPMLFEVNARNTDGTDKQFTLAEGDSIGINFGLHSHTEAVEIVANGLASLGADAFKLYYSIDNCDYTLIEDVTLSRDTRDGKDVYRLSFDTVKCGYLKLHNVSGGDITLDNLYSSLKAYSSIAVENGFYNYTGNRAGDGGFYTQPNGTLVMSYCGFPDGGGDFNECPILVIQSTDGGYTWSDSWIEFQKREESQNVLCSSYIILENGDLGVIYLEKDAMYEDARGERIAHVFIRRSTDSGRTWSSPIRITEGFEGYAIQASGFRYHRLSTGRILVPINYSVYPNDVYGSDRSVSMLLYSDDDGYTWKMSKNAVTLPNSALEPVVTETENGMVLMTLRTRKIGKIFQSVSTDGGLTWSQPHETEGFVTPSSTNIVVKIPQTDDVLFMWNNEFAADNGKRDPLTMAVSADNGISYKNIKNILERGGSWQDVQFYGRSVLMQTGSNITIFDVSDIYSPLSGNKTVADLPKAATPTATYADGWLNGVSDTIQYSLNGGETWKFCGGTSVQIGDVASLMVKDIGTHETAPSDIQTVK